MSINKDNDSLLSNYFNDLLFKENMDIDFIIINDKYKFNSDCGVINIDTLINNDKILDNISFLLHQCLNQKKYLQNIDISFFGSSDTELFLQIIQLFYDYYFYCYQNNLVKSQEYTKLKIPCDFQFLNNKNISEIIEKYLNDFRNINVNLQLLYYTDLNYNDIDQIFIERFFNFIYKNNLDNNVYLIINSKNIHQSIVNYNQWKEQFQLYNKIYVQNKYIYPKIIEDKNEGWIDESIENYLKFLDYYINDNLKIQNINKFTYDCFNSNNKLLKIDISFPFKNNYCCDCNCNLNNKISILCNNLMIIPCRGLNNKIFYGGQLDQNMKINSINCSGYLQLTNRNNYFAPWCIKCEYQEICPKGCCGAQFNAMIEPNVIIPDVCKLLQEKINFLIKKYYNLGIFEIAIKEQYVTEEEISFINNILFQLGEIVNEL